MKKCNYCIRENYKKVAKINDWKMTYVSYTFEGEFPDGMNVYIHPKHIKFDNLKEGEKDRWFVFWGMKIPNSCEC